MSKLPIFEHFLSVGKLKTKLELSFKQKLKPTFVLLNWFPEILRRHRRTRFLVAESPVLLRPFLAEVCDVPLVDRAVLGHVDAELGQDRVSGGGGSVILTRHCINTLDISHFLTNNGILRTQLTSRDQRYVLNCTY